MCTVCIRIWLVIDVSCRLQAVLDEYLTYQGHWAGQFEPVTVKCTIGNIHLVWFYNGMFRFEVITVTVNLNPGTCNGRFEFWPVILKVQTLHTGTSTFELATSNSGWSNLKLHNLWPIEFKSLKLVLKPLEPPQCWVTFEITLVWGQQLEITQCGSQQLEIAQIGI